MVIFLLVAAAAVLAVPLVTGLPGSSPRGRERDRRLRYVARHPEQVNTGDISRMLSRELDRSDVDLIIDRAEALGVKPWTMLSWIQRFDVHTLAVVIAAELSHEELLLHLGNGTLPDLCELEVFAAINGLPAAQSKAARRPASRPALSRPAAVAVRTATPGVTAEAGPITSKMPPIFEPGSWPYDQFSDLPTWPEAPGDPGELAA
ncbi:hypothetical protein [Nocardioides lianchengensis]|uniref:Uncharacterized protein n=1 Tax=Nocardioides lianchengensis TaxID=1045774 RepID=A0A1G6SGN7_9ACTN|nr:hypothetical protein [Nocardioides lianchengensis]NYG09835.1 hypothetical protein [Nocardioides lianchengensis]SDD15943.1 hypothetical protein SAMN05421872_106144 [Nocardioides lianchengensis]